VQAVPDEQDTPKNRLETVPVGTGTDSLVQLVPFQPCAKGFVTVLALVLK
jgi:hypothetical protein